MSSLRIGVLIFDEVELLDFAGPLQVFSAAMSMDTSMVKQIDVIGLTSPVVVSKSLIHVTPNVSIEESAGPYDWLVVPGGMGTRALVKDDLALEKIQGLINRSEITMSVCTGSLVLAKLGLLSGLRATTHFAAVDILKKLEPTTIVDRTVRYIDHGSLVITEGVSAGIDGSFYLLDKYCSAEFSDSVRKYIEYYPEKSS